MSKAFDIKKGKFDVPKLGKVDTTKAELSDERAFELFKLSRKVFPWIKLNANADTFLKKQNLKSDEVAKMVQNASSIEEVEILQQVNDSKTVATIAETKINSFKTKK